MGTPPPRTRDGGAARTSVPGGLGVPVTGVVWLDAGRALAVGERRTALVVRP